MGCPGCGRGFHSECDEGCEQCHGEQDRLAKTISGRVGAPIKPADQLIDRHSTGRKEAKKLFPIPKDHTGKAPFCEWQGKKNCGGGHTPIVGCLNGRQRDRHHGPDKDTINNEVGNVHRICVQCVTGNTRLLTEDLNWIAARDLKIGDKLVGFTESQIPFKRTSHTHYGARSTVFEPSIIEAITTVVKPSSKITMANGTELISSNDHLWVSSSYSDAHLLWRTTQQILPYDTINYLADPWEFDTSWVSGWLAGYIDGEGSLSGNHLGIVQKEGSISDLSSELLNDLLKGKLHYTYRPKKEKHHNNTEVYRVANVPDVLTVLGIIRPYRLLEKIPEYLYGKSALLGRASREIKVVSKESVGEQELYAIQTNTKTFIAEGFFSHNCHHKWHEVNDPEYGEDQHKYAHIPHEPEVATQAELVEAEARRQMKKIMEPNS